MKKYIILCFIFLALLGFSLLFFKDILVRKEKVQNIEAQILQSIVDTMPEFQYKGQPIIDIHSVSQAEKNWYVVIIKSIHHDDEVAVVPVKLVLLRDSIGFKVIDGPDTYFPESRMITLNLPDSVILELKRS